jgi:rhodanese-related sulfurtransferase
MRQLLATELRQMLDTPDATKPVMIDVREPWEWDLAKIDGATNVPMNQIPNRIQEIDSTHPTVVICHHGVRSLQVVAYLQRMGFDNLHNLQGGIDAWSRQVDPSVPLY